jgi:hypothetical protein
MAVVIDTPVRPSRSSFGYGRSSGSEGSARIELSSNQDFLSAALGNPKRFHYSSRDKLYVVNQPSPFGGDHNEAAFDVATVSLGIQALHQCFAAHVALSLRPDTLWYFIVHQVAEFVRQHADDCARLFTDKPGEKQEIRVRDDSLLYDGPSDWMRSINLVRDPLREKITDRTMELFLPTFSTSTIEDETALLVTLMDVVSPYYEFVWETRCGVPQIRLEGDQSDWRNLYDSTDALAREFPGLSGYFTDLLSVLQTIAQTAAGANPDEEFWRSIYKYDDGSGGPYVTGWITAFFAHVQTPQGAKLKNEFNWRSLMSGWGGFRTNEFPTHISRVPFVWEYLGTRIDMAFAAGVTGVDYDDTFLSPRLGFAVVEV